MSLKTETSEQYSCQQDVSGHWNLLEFVNEIATFSWHLLAGKDEVVVVRILYRETVIDVIVFLGYICINFFSATSSSPLQL